MARHEDDAASIKTESDWDDRYIGWPHGRNVPAHVPATSRLNPGSLGHPDNCAYGRRKLCRYIQKGIPCKHGLACDFCHMDHPDQPFEPRQHRQVRQRLRASREPSVAHTSVVVESRLVGATGDDTHLQFPGADGDHTIGPTHVNAPVSSMNVAALARPHAVDHGNDEPEQHAAFAPALAGVWLSWWSGDTKKILVSAIVISFACLLQVFFWRSSTPTLKDLRPMEVHRPSAPIPGAALVWQWCSGPFLRRDGVKNKSLLREVIAEINRSAISESHQADSLHVCLAEALLLQGSIAQAHALLNSTCRLGLQANSVSLHVACALSEHRGGNVSGSLQHLNIAVPLACDGPKDDSYGCHRTRMLLVASLRLRGDIFQAASNVSLVAGTSSSFELRIEALTEWAILDYLSSGPDAAHERLLPMLQSEWLSVQETDRHHSVFLPKVLSDVLTRSAEFEFASNSCGVSNKHCAEKVCERLRLAIYHAGMLADESGHGEHLGTHARAQLVEAGVYMDTKANLDKAWDLIEQGCATLRDLFPRLTHYRHYKCYRAKLSFASIVGNALGAVECQVLKRMGVLFSENEWPAWDPDVKYIEKLNQTLRSHAPHDWCGFHS